MEPTVPAMMKGRRRPNLPVLLIEMNGVADDDRVGMSQERRAKRCRAEGSAPGEGAQVEAIQRQSGKWPKEGFRALVQRSSEANPIDEAEFNVLEALGRLKSCVLIRKGADNRLDQKAWRLRHE